MFNTDAKQCKAKSKRSGKRWQNPAVSGYDVCRIHGANPKNRGGAPNGSRNAMTYGAYVNKLLDDKEKVIFEEFYTLLHDDFVLNKSSDRMSAELACMYFVKLTRAIESGNAEAIYKMDLLVRNQLKDLKATKDKREGDTGGLQTTPAEWMSELLAEYRKLVGKAKKDGGKKAGKQKNKVIFVGPRQPVSD
jgi:hypothetical protein